MSQRLKGQAQSTTIFQKFYKFGALRHKIAMKFFRVKGVDNARKFCHTAFGGFEHG